MFKTILDHIDQLILEEYRKSPSSKDTESLKQSLNTPKRTYFIEIDLGDDIKRFMPCFSIT